MKTTSIATVLAVATILSFSGIDAIPAKGGKAAASAPTQTADKEDKRVVNTKEEKKAANIGSKNAAAVADIVAEIVDNENVSGAKRGENKQQKEDKKEHGKKSDAETMRVAGTQDKKDRKGSDKKDGGDKDDDKDKKDKNEKGHGKVTSAKGGKDKAEKESQKDAKKAEKKAEKVERKEKKEEEKRAKKIEKAEKKMAKWLQKAATHKNGANIKFAANVEQAKIDCLKDSTKKFKECAAAAKVVKNNQRENVAGGNNNGASNNANNDKQVAAANDDDSDTDSLSQEVIDGGKGDSDAAEGADVSGGVVSELTTEESTDAGNTGFGILGAGAAAGVLVGVLIFKRRTGKTFKDLLDEDEKSGAQGDNPLFQQTMARSEYGVPTQMG